MKRQGVEDHESKDGYKASDDVYEAFRNTGSRMPTQSNGILTDWHRLKGDELLTCRRLGDRLSKLVSDYHHARQLVGAVAPHPYVCAADIALITLKQPLHLDQLEAAPDDELLSWYAQVARQIDRERSVWRHVHGLKWAKSRLQIFSPSNIMGAVHATFGRGIRRK